MNRLNAAMRICSRLLHSIKEIQKQVTQLGILERDKIVVRVKAGNGGSGLARYDGIGGRGGHVIVKTRQELAFSHVFKDMNPPFSVAAKSGTGAMKTKLIGDDAPHTVIEVPLGVELVNEDTGVLIERCDRSNYSYYVAKGGEGGRRENNYRPTKGEEVRVSIHMKLRPNLALLGFPNAGKSTLVKALIPEKSVKIASYPFTTVKPQMAFWSRKGQEEEEGTDSPFTLSLADLPGLIEGASRNRGRGLSFLKHLDHADIILLVIDINGFQLKNDLGEPFRSALECIALLNMEVEAYNKRILDKPVIVVLNKMDVCANLEEASSLCSIVTSSPWPLPPNLLPTRRFRIVDVVQCSAKKGDIAELKETLAKRSNLVDPANRIH